VVYLRAFLAVDVDVELSYKITELQRQLMETDAPIKMVEPENLHLTFKFFGEISASQMEEIENITLAKLDNYHSFQLHIKGLGVFPNLGYIRVIWLGIENPHEFSTIQRELDQEFVKMGFKKERGYTPHLTIGRVKGAQNKEALVDKIRELEGVDIGEVNVEKIVLKKSELTPVGPIYTDLKEFFI
jgi:2'-5' RNA ligase